MPWYCSICTDFFNNRVIVSTTPCGHVFHLECLMRWIRVSATCPECRQSVSSSRLVKLHLNNENDSDFKAELNEKMEEIRKLGSQCRKAESEAKALFLEKCKLMNADLQKNQFIKSLESKIEKILEMNRILSFENEHLNDVKTIVNDTQSKAEIVLSSYSNVGNEDVAKKLASFCATLKFHLIRVIDEKKKLEINFQQLESKCSNKAQELDRVMVKKKAHEFNLKCMRHVYLKKNSCITQMKKLVEKLKKDISLLEKEKRDSSGYTYSKDTPTTSMRLLFQMEPKDTPNTSKLMPSIPVISPMWKRKRNNEKKVH